MSDGTTNNGGGGSNGAKMLKRYGPFVIIVVVIAVIALIAAGGGDDDTDVKAGGNGNGNGSGSDLPVTFQEAEDQGLDIDFGPTCDPETGRVKVPSNNAAPCVEPWDDAEDNGGATSPGVTGDTIKVAVYVGQNDPLQQALIEGAGADTTPRDYFDTAAGYLRGFEKLYETYGRKLEIVPVNATGGPADEAAARADAIKVVQEIKPFAVLGGPTQTSAYWKEVANAGIMCVGTCVLAESQEAVNENAPYVWPSGIAPEQADALWVEMLGKQVGGGKAEYAGDPDLQDKDRVFGFIGAETEQGEFTKRHENLRENLKEEGIDVVESQTYVFDVSQGQEIARTAINKMKDAGVTSILLTADPLIPANLTREATAQNYFPEWIIGPSVFVDTTIFGRTFDQRQWEHAFGMSVLTARVPREKQESYTIYKWFNGGEEPPVNAQGVPYPGTWYFMTGVHLAGPNLTPETFEEGMFRYSDTGSGIVESHTSWGEALWKGDRSPDHNGADDATMIFWDPDAEGAEDETGNPGTGAYRYVDGGKRYLPGEFPTEKVKWFDKEGTVFLYKDRPADDKLPDYPPPN